MKKTKRQSHEEHYINTACPASTNSQAGGEKRQIVFYHSASLSQKKSILIKNEKEFIIGERAESILKSRLMIRQARGPKRAASGDRGRSGRIISAHIPVFIHVQTTYFTGPAGLMILRSASERGGRDRARNMLSPHIMSTRNPASNSERIKSDPLREKRL